MWQSRGNENEMENLCTGRERVGSLPNAQHNQCHWGEDERKNWIIERKLLYYLWLLGTASSKANRARIIQLNRFPLDFIPFLFSNSIQFHPNRKNFSCIIHDWLIFNSRSFSTRSRLPDSIWWKSGEQKNVNLLCVILVWKFNGGKAAHTPCSTFCPQFPSEFDIFRFRCSYGTQCNACIFASQILRLTPLTYSLCSTICKPVWHMTIGIFLALLPRRLWLFTLSFNLNICSMLLLFCDYSRQWSIDSRSFLPLCLNLNTGYTISLNSTNLWNLSRFSGIQCNAGNNNSSNKAWRKRKTSKAIKI